MVVVVPFPYSRRFISTPYRTYSITHIVQIHPARIDPYNHILSVLPAEVYPSVLPSIHNASLWI